MPDTGRVTSYEEPEPRGWSPLAVAFIATLVLLLGLGGALFGIHVANVNAAALPGPTVTTTPPVPVVTTTAPTTGPTVGPSTTTSAPPTTTTDTFALPDLSPLDFTAARTTVRGLKLGWRLVFEGGSGTGVRASDPPAGTLVKKGDTIKIFVAGSAPLATVPDVTGQPCARAADAIIDSGLYPKYPTGRSGTVATQVPTAAAPPALHWNDEVSISCS